ncbi:MAG: hypothetical protein MUF15_16560 [Acidobacteria bacterium]|nr:hypothetical protein [Acidobacteriota bacterium]
MKLKIFLTLLTVVFLLNFGFLNQPLEAQNEPPNGQRMAEEKQEIQPGLSTDEKILEAMHGISSHTLLDYVKELCGEKYSGRLTGTDGYNAAAQWVVSLLQKWGIQPMRKISCRVLPRAAVKLKAKWFMPVTVFRRRNWVMMIIKK